MLYYLLIGLLMGLVATATTGHGMTLPLAVACLGLTTVPALVGRRRWV